MDLHTHTAGEAGLFVNSYLLETPSTVVVVDTGLLVDDITALRNRVAALGKPLAAVFVTHAHPDHFNGVHGLVHDVEVPVYATSGVAKAIREVADAKRVQWGPVYGDQWPTTTTYPTRELADGQTVNFDGFTIAAHEYGPGESHADSLFIVTADDGARHAFIGDLAFHGTHPYTADGHTTDWLSTLDRLTDDIGDATVHPGHGGPGTARMFVEQLQYLMFYRELVRRLADGATTLTDPAKAELDAALQRYLPSAPLTWMIALGADAVAMELNGDTHA